jgi:hypothetical protein
VWVNQEIAILAYRQFFEERHLPLLCFREAGVVLEGAMTASNINTLALGGSYEVLAALEVWSEISRWEDLLKGARGDLPFLYHANR